MPPKKHSEQLCWSVKNRKSKERCDRHALLNSEYCGYHVKNPTRFIPVVATTPATTPAIAPAITKIQQFWRYTQARLHGPALYFRNLANNTEDFCSFDLIGEIPQRYFFSYLDRDGFVYAFDIRSLFQLMDSGSIQNPYNRQEFSTIVLQKLNKLRRLAIMTKLNIHHESPELSPEHVFRSKVVDIFQQIDNLDFYTDPDWFMVLDVPGLQLLYQTLFTMFTARSELTREQQRNIIPENPFRTRVSDVKRLTDKVELQRIALDTIRIMVTSSPEHNNQKLAALYVLMSFVYIDKRAARAYPYLIQ